MFDVDVVSRFERLGYKISIDQIAFTTESVEDFVNARLSDWTAPGTVKVYEEPGLLVVEGAQPRAGRLADGIKRDPGHAFIFSTW